MVTGDLNFWIPNTLRIPKLVKAVYSVVLHLLQIKKREFFSSMKRHMKRKHGGGEAIKRHSGENLETG